MKALVPVKMWAIDEATGNEGRCRFCQQRVMFYTKRYRSVGPILVVNKHARVFRGHVTADGIHRCDKKKKLPFSRGF